MAADVSESAHSAIGAAHENHALAAIIDAVPVAGVRDVAVVADNLPAWAENTLHFGGVEIGIAVRPCGKRPAVLGVDVVESVAQRCHCPVLVVRTYNNMQP